jgi:hypothetical protein
MKMPKIRDIARSSLLALGGIVLYVPAAIGLIVEDIRRGPDTDDDRWRFVLSGMTQCLGPTAKKAGLWAHMNLRQCSRCCQARRRWTPITARSAGRVMTDRK